MSWGYGKTNGPDTWADLFPIAKGTRQSPVDIVPQAAHFDLALQKDPLTATYFPESGLFYSNTGLSMKADINEASVISGGPLTGKYRLEQFHIHWGSKNDQGSEHTLEGITYAAELHLVHWNCDKYTSFKEAVSEPDGLAVLGIFMKVGKEHMGFKALSDCLDKVKFKNDHNRVQGQFNPKCLLPENMTEYWTYPGSLTTPPLLESVTWIVFKEIMEVSEDQMKALRSLCCGDCEGDHILDNYRPPCSLGSRQIKASFKSS